MANRTQNTRFGSTSKLSRTKVPGRLEISVRPPCSLCLRGGFLRLLNHRGTESTQTAQRKPRSALPLAQTVHHSHYLTALLFKHRKHEDD
jgi:hypothetical protein